MDIIGTMDAQNWITFILNCIVGWYMFRKISSHTGPLQHRPPPLRPSPLHSGPHHSGPLPYRPPTIPAPYVTGPLLKPFYSDCMYTQLLKLRYWISSPVKMIHVQYPKVNSITKKYFMEMNDRLQNLSILLHFRKIKYIDSKESWWTILYLIAWYEPLSCRWHSYAWPK